MEILERPIQRESKRRNNERPLSNNNMNRSDSGSIVGLVWVAQSLCGMKSISYWTFNIVGLDLNDRHLLHMHTFPNEKQIWDTDDGI